MSERPIRDKIENRLEERGSGPMGKIGSGKAVGAAGFLAVESSKPFFDFIPGVKQPGYKVTAHGTKPIQGGTRHIIDVAAISEDVAEFAANYTAANSNAEFLFSETKTESIEVLDEDRLYSIWRIKVDIGEPEDI